jgi:tetratricopeptide (TPR) repeat protein
MATRKKTGGNARTTAASKPSKAKPKKATANGALEPIHPVEFEGTLVSLLGGGRSGRRGGAKQDVGYQAQQLIYQAFESRDPRRRVELSRQALAIWPDCADAYVILAEMTRDPTEATELNRNAVEAGERALGANAFVEDVGHFWGILETRPYMRARLAFAQCLWAAGKRDEAIENYRGMLLLNPGDNQGVRYILAACLLDVGRDDQVAELISHYNDDASAAWAYASALIAFRRQGDSEDARQLLAEAKSTNPHVPAYLTGKKKMPKQLPDMLGSVTRARRSRSSVTTAAAGCKRRRRSTG